MRRLRPYALIIVVVALALYGFTRRDVLYRWAFELTGEESPTSQLIGLLQVVQGLSYPRPDTRPYVAIDHTGVNPFGINTFLHHEVEVAKREEQLRLIAEAGFHWIRQEFPWEDIEIHARGDFIDRRNDPAGIDAWAKYDNIVELVEKYDLEIIARLSNPPAWSRAAGDAMGTYAPPDDFDDFANFAATVAERYQGRIRYYQIWNEPNIYPEWGEQNVNPEAYTDLLCRAYRAIKAVDPRAVILSGALAPTAELSGRDFNDYLFLQRMYAAGAGQCFDILSMQGYGLWSGPTDHRLRPLIVNYGRNQFIREIMVENGDAHKPIWISEMNWNAAPLDVEPRYGRVTLEQQARWAPLAYQRAQEEWPWIGVINFWYFKRASDDWLVERRPEAYFQMAAPDFTLMPVYEAMKAYTGQPPVMYAGYHWADHWAVHYGEGWSPWLHARDRARIASNKAEPITFTFQGTLLGIVLGAHEEPGYGVAVSVDGGRERTLTDCCLTETIWRGHSDRHQVVLRPIGRVVIVHFVVRDDPSPTLALIGVAVVLLAAAAMHARRRHAREGGFQVAGEGS